MKNKLYFAVFVFVFGFISGFISMLLLSEYLVMDNYIEPCEVYLPVTEICNITAFPKQ